VDIDGFGLWTDGSTGTGVGYEDAPDLFDELIETDIGADWNLYESSAYARLVFDEVVGANAFDRLLLRMKYDDGFVAYLNGVEIARSENVPPGPPAFDTRIVGTAISDTEALIYKEFDVTPYRTLLNGPGEGSNVLSVHLLNAAVTSSDMLLVPQLVGQTLISDPAAVPVWYTLDGSDPRDPATGGPSDTAVLVTQSISLDASTHVRARTWINGTWSAASDAVFTVDVPLRVSELMYNPPGSDDAEFLELVNTGTESLDLTGVTILGLGDDYVFLGTDNLVSLAPGGRVVVPKNLTAFAAAYPETPGSVIADRPYTGSLDNSGETVTILDSAGGLVQQFRYENRTSEGWYSETDGDGFSLVVIDTAGDYDNPANWRSSARSGGSPGAVDPEPVVGDIDGDGTTSRTDAAILLRNLGRTGDAYRTTGDLDGDRRATLADLALLQTHLGDAVVAPGPVPGAAQASSSSVFDKSLAVVASDAARSESGGSHIGKDVVRRPRSSRIDRIGVTPPSGHRLLDRQPVSAHSQPRRLSHLAARYAVRAPRSSVLDTDSTPDELAE
jgi:hypothetical protein